MSDYIYKKNKLTDARYENINKERVNKNSGFTLKKDDLTDARYENINNENNNSTFYKKFNKYKKTNLSFFKKLIFVLIVIFVYHNTDSLWVFALIIFTIIVVTIYFTSLENKTQSKTANKYTKYNSSTTQTNFNQTKENKNEDKNHTSNETTNKYAKSNSSTTQTNFNQTKENKNEDKNHTSSNYKRNDDNFSHKVQRYKSDIYKKKGFASMDAYLDSLDFFKRKGVEYELYVGKEFANRGYRVYPNGLINNFKDDGIDILAWKKDSVAIIQCKNWSSSPKQEELRKFYGDACHWIQNNKIKIKNRKTICFFVTSCPILDKGTKHYLEKNKNITYEIII